MAIATYNQITGPDGLLANRKAFTGNSMSARWTADGNYVVYSYSTIICVVEPDIVLRSVIDGKPTTGERVTYNERKYSRTTSRQQNACKAWIPFGSH